MEYGATVFIDAGSPEALRAQTGSRESGFEHRIISLRRVEQEVLHNSFLAMVTEVSVIHLPAPSSLTDI